MCFFAQQTHDARQLQERFRATFPKATEFVPAQYNGFQHPRTPVITNEQPDTIQLYQWGLLPHWAKDTTLQANTLNARIETIHQKPSFRDAVAQRCLVLVDGFYEWQWLDEKGKKKQKYLITLPDGEPFAFAGLYNEWVHRATGEMIPTYTILTTEANELMAIIHNTKKRMPVILPKGTERDWLQGAYDGLSLPIELEATPV